MAAFEYVYATGCIHGVTADKVGEVLETIQNANGKVTPEALVEASRDEDSILHGEFEWNDSIAAEKYRIDQARRIIMDVRIVQVDGKKEEYNVRAFVSAPGGTHEYVPIHMAIEKMDYREHLLDEAKRDMKAFISKYKRITELAGVVNAMAEFVQMEMDIA